MFDSDIVLFLIVSCSFLLGFVLGLYLNSDI